VLRAFERYKQERAARATMMRALLDESENEQSVDTLDMMMTEAIDTAHQNVSNN
jgi:hypothetical protein